MQNRFIPVTGLLITLTILLITTVSATNVSCSLSVASIPQGSEVIIDGNYSGITPVANVPVICGSHTVLVNRNGYEDYTSNVSIEEGTHRDIIANLNRLPDRGKVTIRSEPPGGDLFVDGKIRGVTPLIVDNLMPGRHEVLIRKTGYEDYRDVISAATDITTEYTEYLVPLPGAGFLSVSSFPEGADVRIDGNDAGTTPTNLQRITSGNHTVDITKTGYWNFTGIVNIKGGESTLAKADLAMIPTTCTLYIDSSPQGQGVYLNDSFKGSTPLNLETIPSGYYVLRMFRSQNSALVNRSFGFSPGSTHEIFVDLTDTTGGSVTDQEWQYQNESSMMSQPGWLRINTTPVIEKKYTWIANNHEATITLDIPKDLYTYYKNQPHPTNITPDTFSAYVINENDRQYLHTLINKLKDANDFKSYAARNDYRNVVAFVQSITYQGDSDQANNQADDYWKYPIETLADGNGDCEDTAILAAALLKEMRYDVAVVILPEHAAVAVTCETCNGYYYPLNGRRYYYLETTGSGFSPGTMDAQFQSAKATIIPI
ncbi:MAG: PEGA domain-containing protein [Methanoregula sp.]|nr:PEGA domain-containing protein [Methanoregula sp.]